MFCPSCGAETKEGLRYCNRCGANLVLTKQAPPRLFVLIVILSIAALVAVVLGFGMIFFFGSETTSRGNVEPIVVLFLIVFTLVVLATIWLIVKQLARLIGVYLETGETPARQTKIAAADITADAPQQIAGSTTTTAPNLPPASTIPIDAEQMTRKFEEQ